MPLTERGERNARSLGERLKGLRFAAVLTSPLQRAVRTCALAGFGVDAKVDRDLLEWEDPDSDRHRHAHRGLDQRGAEDRLQRLELFVTD